MEALVLRFWMGINSDPLLPNAKAFGTCGHGCATLKPSFFVFLIVGIYVLYYAALTTLRGRTSFFDFKKIND